MAFQAGSRIRPELGNADFSGFANAATIQANALANLGKQIGEGIEKYKENKDITIAGLASLEGQVAADPTLLVEFENDTGDVGKAYKNIQSGDYKRKDVLIAGGFAASYANQRNMDSMKAGQTKRPTIGDITKLREFLPSDKVIEDGRIVDTTLRNEILPENHPLVQQLLQTDVGQSQLYGYQDSEFLETKEDDGTPVEPAEIIETPSINVQEEPTGSRASQLLSSIQDLNKTRQDAMSSARSLPLALGNFLFSGENPTFSESMNYAKPKMETLETFLPLGASPRNVDPRRFQRMYSEGMNFFK